jgi:Helicase conserved C-terminal domain
LKSHLRDARTGIPLFRERKVIPVKVEVTDAALEPVRRFHRALAALIAPRLRKATRRRDEADALAFVSLLKRSVSTISSCVATLQVVADRYRARVEEEIDVDRRHRERALRAYRRKLLRFGVLAPGEESDLAELEADGMAANLQSFAAAELLLVTKASATLEALEKLIALGQAAAPYDPKINAVRQEVCDIRATHPGANILIYTEYVDSQAAVVQALRNSTDGEVLSINGVDSEAARTHVAVRCAEEDGIVLVSTDSLAEGLNLQQRCFNLIHLDLPYNPNRLEQRNGRIDRYGQRRDPQIRYLYLAGTFEEKLLLQLIRKFERAQSHLTFMPDTLGVTADESDTDLGLIAGFAEQQEGLFDDEPVVIRTIDREAEAANSDSYRDLLREIDRAFDGFNRSAVRHGWLDDHAPADTSAAIPIGQASAGVVDLPDFVAAAIKEEAAHCVDAKAALRLPTNWRVGLDGLPGFEQETGTFRFTRDHTKLLDSRGRSLGVLGRTHPLVRRAISVAHTLSGDTYDSRVSVARIDSGNSLSVLFTFNVELRGVSRVELQRVIAVSLSENGEVIEYERPEQWLPNAEASCGAVSPDSWPHLFAHWVPQRQREVWSVAEAAMRREADRAIGDLRQQTERAASDLQDWLHRRANVICGVREPMTGDLFGAAPQGPDWRFAAAPLERLARYAADAGNSPERRREADGTIQSFHLKDNDLAAYANVTEPMLQPIGMLMLVPSSRA